MPNIDEDAKAWQKDAAERAGAAILAARNRAGLTAVQLADKTRELGYPIHRVAISKIENGTREGKLDVAELVVLAYALNTPALELLYPAMPDGPVRVTPKMVVPSWRAATTFSGERNPDGSYRVDGLHDLALELVTLERQRKVQAPLFASNISELEILDSRIASVRNQIERLHNG